ncbi:MAG: ABC transporter permease [Bacillota bacterium]
MAIFNLALKNFKSIGKNYLLLGFLILIPIMQLYMIHVITNNANAAAAVVYESFVDVIFTSKVSYINLMQAYTAGILVQFILLTGMIAGSAIVGERESNTMLRLYSAPISRLKLLFGILLGHSTVILLVAASIIAAAALFFDVSWGASWINVIIVTLAAILTAAAMAFLISGIFKSSKVAGGVMSIVVIGMTFLSGGIIQSESLDIISNFTINKWISEAYLMLMQGKGIQDIMSNLIILALLSITMLLAASMIYRRENIYE